MELLSESNGAAKDTGDEFFSKERMIDSRSSKDTGKVYIFGPGGLRKACHCR